MEQEWCFPDPIRTGKDRICNDMELFVGSIQFLCLVWDTQFDPGVIPRTTMEQLRGRCVKHWKLYVLANPRYWIGTYMQVYV